MPPQLLHSGSMHFFFLNFHQDIQKEFVLSFRGDFDLGLLRNTDSIEIVGTLAGRQLWTLAGGRLWGHFQLDWVHFAL